MTGYAHPEYAASLAEFGSPYQLPQCGGNLLIRPIQGQSAKDAMSCYPLFSCLEWSRLHHDLNEIGSNLVSITMVTDPFGNYTADYLQNCFQHIARPFKQHFVVDLTQPVISFVSSHHRRNARKALRDVEVELCSEPTNYLDEWVNLYGCLVERHKIKGIATFSRMALAKQLIVPGLVMFRASHRQTTIGIILWYIQDEVAYYHLAAYNQIGYKLRASFALFWTAINYFADSGLHWLNLGAGAGVQGNDDDGLIRFKRGWSTGTRTAYLCGRIFDQIKYDQLIQARGIAPTNYFPAYRQGEFN